jgi:signal transduction histidine kinase
MGAELICPRCGRTILPPNRFCEHCGVDIAVAAVIAEQAVLLPVKFPSGLPIVPEILVPRIGEYMIERDLIKPEELQRALIFQEERAAVGKPILIGQALLELGMTQRETLDQIITTQILELQTALDEANRRLSQRVHERTLELEKALERLSELNLLKANFIANISHELRTPLTHIKGYLDLLKDGGLGPLTSPQEEAVEVLMRAETKLERLIDDLIQFSVASRGELSLELRTIDIRKCVQNAVDRNKPKAKEKAISVKTAFSPGLPLARVDEDKIGWVLSQLLDNAIKFTPRSGQVVVQADAGQGPITMAISDTGIGIPEERIGEIFEPFHQLDGSPTRRYPGTGLGLTMVKRIVEAHGTDIKVKSAVGKGTRFEFSLPVALETTGESTAPGTNE